MRFDHLPHMQNTKLLGRACACAQSRHALAVHIHKIYTQNIEKDDGSNHKGVLAIKQRHIFRCILYACAEGIR